ncbi:MAG: TMEM175 family protein [Saprospiraceae bacterium]
MLKQFSEETEKNRFETFVDAILAIIMTILVLEFKVPEGAFTSDGDLKLYLSHLAPSFLSYFISFSTIVILWMDHHNLFRLLKKVDIPLVFLNFLFLLFLSATPFTTSLAGRNFESPYAVTIVAVNYVMMNLAFSSIWIYTMKNKMIPEGVLKKLSSKFENIIIFAGILLQVASIPLAYVSTYISFILFIVVLILHILRLWRH